MTAEEVDRHEASDAHAIAARARLIRFRRHANAVRESELSRLLADAWFVRLYPGVAVSTLRTAILDDAPLGRHLRTLVTLPVEETEAERRADFERAKRELARSYEAHRRAKAAARAKDDADLREGRVTRDELRAANGMFSAFDMSASYLDRDDPEKA